MLKLLSLWTTLVIISAMTAYEEPTAISTNVVAYPLAMISPNPPKG